MTAAQLERATPDLVLLGGPGSGKGTQAERLCAELGLPHIATGDLFRENLRQATDLGKLAQTYMNRGELVPDDVTEAMVEERLARPDTQGGFILDGFPRTVSQAGALTEMMTRLRRRIAAVLYIKVSDEALVGRLSGRMICRACQAPYHLQFKPPHKPGVCDSCRGELYQRADDNPATVRARLVTFHRQTEPLIAYYRPAGLLHEIDGEGPLAKVSARSLAALRPLVPGAPAPASAT
ncbi:MAG: adenylate kinase [Lacunisphaera sp.]|nr:adenylate kinase [Lacunisphaera sp.]